MLDLIGEAAAYLSAPAGRARWQDTWTMKRTRREAMGHLASAYASWLRTVCGVLVTVVALGGAFLLGRGAGDLSGPGGLVAVLTMVGGVVLLLAALVGAGYVLLTGTRLVGALRTWSAARADDGGPGVGKVLTPAVMVRLVLALLALLSGLAVVLVRTDVLNLDLPLTAGGAPDEAGQTLWAWFAAVIAMASGLAAGSGAVRAGLAVRRRPRTRRAAPAAQAAASQQQYAPQPGGGMSSGAGGATAPGGLDLATSAPAGAGAPTGAAGWQPPATMEQPVPVEQPVPPSAPGSSAEEQWAETRKVGDLPAEARPTAEPMTTALRAVLADGRTIAAEGLTLLGRSPAGRAGEQVAAVVAVEDAAVSKTHLAIRLEGAQGWVTDRASTNGSVLVRDGNHETLTPWQEVLLAAGDRLLLGTSTVQIEAAS
ncbi:FHA domain-containing protein [Ruania albidiflava]|uniref:FHA domain-containing protein n=1 Tax=Ruania albidiflava TaxID=366586 RepID=UPI0003B47BB2|nr:FHA domain-containing protein [Ruania albidiflava]